MGGSNGYRPIRKYIPVCTIIITFWTIIVIYVALYNVILRVYYMERYLNNEWYNGVCVLTYFQVERLRLIKAYLKQF